MNVCVTEAIVCSSAGRDKCSANARTRSAAPLCSSTRTFSAVLSIPHPTPRARVPGAAVSLRAAPSTQQGGCYLPDHEEG